MTVIGYCFGGVLSLLYGSIFHDGPMKNLICFTTPIDFREMKLFQNFSDRRYFDVDRLVDSVGNVPPEMILSSFEMLRPASRAASQVQLWENIWNDEFVKSYRMFDRWATDTLPLAGEYFRTITKDLMWDNKLYNDTMSVGGRPADTSASMSAACSFASAARGLKVEFTIAGLPVHRATRLRKTLPPPMAGETSAGATRPDA